MNSNYTLLTIIAELPNNISNPRNHFYNVCLELPPNVVSDGIWASHTTGALPSISSFTILELQIITIFTVTQSFHFFLKRTGLPYLVSQVMAGFLLGPSIPTGPFDKYKQMLFPYGSPDILNAISSLGYAFFLFLNAVQADFTLTTKTGKKAWAIGLTSVLTPIAIGYLVIESKTFFPFWESLLGNYEATSLLAVVISHSGCSFTVIAQFLTDLGILNSEIGRLALSSSFVINLSSGIFVGIGTAIFKSYEIDTLMIMMNVIYYIAFITLVPLAGRPLLRWVERQTPEDGRVNKTYTYAIIVALLLLGFLAGQFHQPFLSGALVFGLVVPEGPPLGAELIDQLDLFATSFLTPIFITCCSMKLNLTLLPATPTLVAVILFFIVMVHLIKWILCISICRFCNIPLTDSFCLALILSCKGVVDICSYMTVYDTLSQSEEAISVMIISVLMVGTISAFGVKTLYDPSRKYAGYQKRNIINLKPNSELRVVACMHKPSHMIPIKNVLQLCSPSPGNELVVDLLHLMELVGRASPIFIAHHHQQKKGGESSHHNYSGEVIVTFNLFEREYAGSASINTYTAISPFTLMYEDVCHLALDKFASLIILPFHIRWTEDGGIESNDNNIRSLNTMVLERAPCSVGILVSHGGHRNSSNYNVAMIFLGGHDDREALCFAKRTFKDPNNNLVVYRLLARDRDITDWEHMIDDEALREVRGTYVKIENVTYQEKTAEDASHTTSFLKDIADKYDFIIVGRRHGIQSSQIDGLENWTEYSELGVIGDLLASPDMRTTASILVVQQQHTATKS
ncbi:PREDICTED: cation/H(+) antiporter 3-like [Lupinus angustifolius]|nr:PREDICTED: cation/H(+) antiporter 3-like [Lupinus angustifolius]